MEEFNPDKVVGRKVKQLREMMRLNQTQLVALVNREIIEIGAFGIPKNGIGLIESGGRALRHYEALAVCRVFRKIFPDEPLNPEYLSPWDYSNLEPSGGEDASESELF